MMRKVFILSAALLLCVTACNKDRIAPSDLPDIRFGLHVSDAGDTKALLETDDLLTAGTQVKVYGFATDDLTGHLEDGTPVATPTKLNLGQTIQYGGTPAKWAFVGNNNELYQWKYNQDHKFFGWLAKDAKSNIEAGTFFGSGFTFSSNVLAIPTKEMGISATNLDFAYSDIITRSKSSADYSTVDLSLYHLFASFSLSATNYSTKQVTIKKIELHGLRDSKSATINYSGTSVAVTYTGGSVINRTLYDAGSGSGIALAAAGSTGDSKANVVGTPSTSPVYFLVWPQKNVTGESMEYTGTTDTDGNPTPVTTDANQPYIAVTYDPGDGAITAYAPIPHDTDGWAAGVRHEMELSFRDREMDLGLKGAPWDKQDPIIDYNGAVSVVQKLRLAPEFYNNCTLSPDGKTAYFKPGVPIILEFSIGTPENATWMVGKELDWDVFDVYNYPDGARKSPDDIVKAEGTIDGNLVRIAIDPPTGDLQKSEYSLELTFSVRLNNGDIVSIKAEDIFAEGCPRKFVFIRQ